MMVEHTVKAYEDELRRLESRIVEMGERVGTQLCSALEAVEQKDAELASRVVATDDEVDEQEQVIFNEALRVLALRQPVADDLRKAIAAIKVVNDIERIGDMAKNLARRVLGLSEALPTVFADRLVRMGQLVAGRLGQVLLAYRGMDAAAAREVWLGDQEIDDWNHALHQDLLEQMKQGSLTVAEGTQLLFMAKNIERAGDHCTRIAAQVHFLVKGDPLTEPRPKGQGASL